jgi:excisionase family DNA binding protein
MKPITKLMKPEEVAEMLGVTVPTLAIWRCTKRYPLPYIKVGRSVRYSEDSVREFLRSRTKAA